VAVLVAVVVTIALVAVALGTSGSSMEAGGLRLERSQTEVTIYVEDPADNQASRADGRRTVLVECLDREDQLLVRSRQAWPFADTDSGTLDAHAHLPLDAASMGRLARCRVEGTDPVLESGTL